MNLESKKVGDVEKRATTRLFTHIIEIDAVDTADGPVLVSFACADYWSRKFRDISFQLIPPWFEADAPRSTKP